MDLDSRLGLARDGDVEAFMRRLVVLCFGVLSLRLPDQATKAVGICYCALGFADSESRFNYFRQNVPTNQ